MSGEPFTILGCTVFPTELSSLIPLMAIPPGFLHCSNNILTGEKYNILEGCQDSGCASASAS